MESRLSTRKCSTRPPVSFVAPGFSLPYFILENLLPSCRTILVCVGSLCGSTSLLSFVFCFSFFERLCCHPLDEIALFTKFRFRVVCMHATVDLSGMAFSLYDSRGFLRLCFVFLFFGKILLSYNGPTPIVSFFPLCGSQGSFSFVFCFSSLITEYPAVTQWNNLFQWHFVRCMTARTSPVCVLFFSLITEWPAVTQWILQFHKISGCNGDTEPFLFSLIFMG